MRDAFCKAMVALAARGAYFFLTGDLGFMALEPLEKALGRRFINAGVAEQNMVSVAAGMALVPARSPGSTASRPFATRGLRADPQRCLPARAAGVAGGQRRRLRATARWARLTTRSRTTACCCALPSMRVVHPGLRADRRPIVVAHARARPRRPTCAWAAAKLEDESRCRPYAPWRRLQEGEAGVLVAGGPARGRSVARLRERAEARAPALWVVSELPVDARDAPPAGLLAAGSRGGH